MFAQNKEQFIFRWPTCYQSPMPRADRGLVHRREGVDVVGRQTQRPQLDIGRLVVS